MAQRKPIPERLEIDEEWLEQLRRDPAVVVHRRPTDAPFVSQLRVKNSVDVLELIGRYDEDDEQDDGELPS